jgi:hypothetical protein
MLANSIQKEYQTKNLLFDFLTNVVYTRILFVFSLFGSLGSRKSQRNSILIK